MVFLQDKRIVVIGGGHVATRRIKRLLPYKPQITVISPEITDDLKKLVDNNAIEWFNKQYTPGDSADALLVIVATNSPSVNQLVSDNITDTQLLNVAGQPEMGNIHFPSSFSNGDLIIAISTNGSSPKLAKKIKEDLFDRYDYSYSEYLVFLKTMRQKILQLPNEYQKLKDEILQEMTRDCYINNLKRQKLLGCYIDKLLRCLQFSR